MSLRLSYTATQADRTLPLRELLIKRLHLSTAQRIACQSAGGVTVDGAFLYANRCVPVGAVVDVSLPDPPPSDLPPEAALPLTILREDEALLVVEKPVGMLVHPSRAQYGGTLLGAVLGHLQRTGQPLCAYPVHRLDRGTSGLVVFAKHPHAQARLMEAMARGLLQKRYEALAFGAFPAEMGEIDVPIARESEAEGSLRRRAFRPAEGEAVRVGLPDAPNPIDAHDAADHADSHDALDPSARPSQRRIVRADGQAALTRYRVLERCDVGGQQISRVRFEPITGRTHQLRVHSLAMGCPLLGDPLYHTPASLALSQELGLVAQMLHATRLCFPHPLSDVQVCVESPVPWWDGLDTYIEARGRRDIP